MAKKPVREKAPAGTSGAGSRETGARDLVIVESPAKAKTINKYLGSRYVVKACNGHVRDLPQHHYGIDPGRNFEPHYEILPSRRKLIADLKKLADKAEIVFLATDLDREGEAIAWHLAHALELPPTKIKRVVFNEITKTAVAAAFEHPHEINIPKVEAQQARRILDRVVGYELSPLLWKKVAKGLSAGRVQSVAVRLIAEREGQIRAFVPEESWAVNAVFSAEPNRAAELAAKWHHFLGEGDAGASRRTQKQRLAWLGECGCFEASLVQVGGKPFRAEGRLDRTDPAQPSFTSASDAVRPLVEALGFRVRSVDAHDWKDYAHLGLKQIAILGELDPTATPAFTVKSVETKRSSARPSAPLTTAAMQQAAVNQLRFSTSKTMRTAQGLYEGLDIGTGEGNVGLITYMRTDSTNLSNESVAAVRGWIGETFGDQYLPKNPNRFGKPKQAQEAHEAIRPTNVTRTPEAMRGHMTSDQHRLYTLIWNRFVACQMVPALWDSTTVLLAADTPRGEVVFKATGRVLVFDGFYKVLGVPKSSDDQLLPAIKTDQRTAPIAVAPVQKFTSPAARFNEASLVKTLEAEGIGRPSTYASIIKTIQDRGYVEQIDRRFHPTHRGEIVTQRLVAHFPKIMNVQFTSHVEEDLDKIEEQHMDWHEVLHEFYDPFKDALARAHEEMEALGPEPSDYTCDDCGKPMVYRHGKNGRFLACSGYPDCTVSRDVDRDGKLIAPVAVNETCELCGKPMALRRSRHGPFLGCTGYPECSNIKPCTEEGVLLKKVEPDEIKQPCPECGAAMQVKFSGSRSFLGCSGYPKCKETMPLPEGLYVEKPKPEDAGAPCDKCGRPMVIRRSRRGPFLSCSGFPRCRNAMPTEKLDYLKEHAAAGKTPAPPPDSGGANGPAKNGNGRRKGRAKNLTPEEIKALGPPPSGFAWTRTGRPVVETWPDGPLTCFECGGEMTARTGRFGPFFSCPKCKAAANLRGEAKKQAETHMPAPAKPKPIETDVACPDCGGKMLLRMGRTGRFLGCGNYPKCKKTMEPPPGLLREVAAT